MKRVTKIAIKTPSGKVKTSEIGSHHDDMGIKGKRGFIVRGEFTGRAEAAKIADKAGQTKRPVKKLHSSNLT